MSYLGLGLQQIFFRRTQFNSYKEEAREPMRSSEQRATQDNTVPTNVRCAFFLLFPVIVITMTALWWVAVMVL